ncbi:glycoside hydrolase family protein [Rhodobacter capsulatus]|uniref:lysozyme n=1 Tax=Rhodobacter capsulatus TaxID=1061 RepID=UPI00114249B9|nr:peptidoglycan-binding protein [Rhodobacter capsulatus]TQD37457.1 lysozyme [Rhodobacter capsulatus]
MQTSEKGIETLVLEEGDVLRAYRCPAGKWTIGPGLTAASGVVSPNAGMVITAQQSRDLTKKALAAKYEPRVALVMAGAKQHEFDAGVLFDWNTGAINKASWVPLWARKAGAAAISMKFRLWNKGGGKVLPGLVKRRERELRILIDGMYPVLGEPSRPSVSIARWVLQLDFAEKLTAMSAFGKLGYVVGLDSAAIPAAEIRRFQADHGLTADGKIGRATLSTLQRRIDAAEKAKSVGLFSGGVTASAVTSAAPTGMSDITDWIASQPWAIGAAAAVIGLWGLWLAWQYRDVIAAKIQGRAPRLAAALRSI